MWSPGPSFISIRSCSGAEVGAGAALIQMDDLALALGARASPGRC